ncbi:MAG: hypothetical protein ACRCZ0_12595 [Cetobacterium sp.]
MAKQKINIMIQPDVYKELQKKAVDLGTSVSQLIENISRVYLEK